MSYNCVSALLFCPGCVNNCVSALLFLSWLCHIIVFLLCCFTPDVSYNCVMSNIIDGFCHVVARHIHRGSLLTVSVTGRYNTGHPRYLPVSVSVVVSFNCDSALLLVSWMCLVSVFYVLILMSILVLNCEVL